MKFPISRFNLELTLASGQFFRFQKAREGFICQQAQHIFRIRSSKSHIDLEGWDEDSFRVLFGLDDLYDHALRELNKDSVMKPILARWQGLRLMNRDPWETSISFLASTASNIPKIRLNMELLSRHFGRAVSFGKKTYYTFPQPGSLIDPAKIQASRLGFRSDYIYKFNRLYSSKTFQTVQKWSYDRAHIFLQQFPGVGPKVADCICLFALNKKEAFPCDVWIERIMKEKFGVKKKNIASFARKRWGPFAGYAQQFLYHEARTQNYRRHS